MQKKKTDMANTGLSPNTILMAPTLAFRAAEQENMNQSCHLHLDQNRIVRRKSTFQNKLGNASRVLVTI
jgi:hypothetical protein